MPSCEQCSRLACQKSTTAGLGSLGKGDIWGCRGRAVPVPLHDLEVKSVGFRLEG
jgi:hypothetical protein